MKKSVALFTNIAPHYRERLWNILADEKELDFNFFFGPSLSIKEIDFTSANWTTHKPKLRSLTNRTFKGILFWQSGVLTNVLQKKWDSVIFLGDMFIISTWLASIVLKFRGVPIIFWGHGIYGNESVLKRKIRILFFQLADKHLLYGNHGRNQMINAGFKEQNLFTVYNSLDYDVHIKKREFAIDHFYYSKKGYFDNNQLPILVFIGRLTPQKKLDQLIDAVLKINNDAPSVNLMIVGEGPEMTDLQKKIKSGNRNIYFYGASYDEDEIGKLLANATLCVSPGNIGLSAIHALSFGTPVCTHDNMKEQMPEAEVIEDGKTGILFNQKLGNLSDAILNWLDQNKDRESIRVECFKTIDEKYNPYYQLEIIKKAINQTYSENFSN